MKKHPVDISIAKWRIRFMTCDGKILFKDYVKG